MLCFTVDNRTSYENIRVKWITEIKHYFPSVQIILVGTRIDLRNDPEVIKRLKDKGMDFVNYDQGNRLATRIGAVKYVECSGKLNICYISDINIDFYC